MTNEQLYKHTRSMIEFLEKKEKELVQMGATGEVNSSSNKRKLYYNETNKKRKKIKEISGEKTLEHVQLMIKFFEEKEKDLIACNILYEVTQKKSNLENRIIMFGVDYTATINDINIFFKTSLGILPTKIKMLKALTGLLSGSAVVTFEREEIALNAEKLVISCPQNINGKRINIFSETTINTNQFPQLLICCDADFNESNIKELLEEYKVAVKSIRFSKDKSGNSTGQVYIDVVQMKFDELIKLKKKMDGMIIRGKKN